MAPCILLITLEFHNSTGQDSNDWSQAILLVHGNPHLREVALTSHKEAPAELQTQVTSLQSLSRLAIDGFTLNQMRLNTLLLEHRSICDLYTLDWLQDPKNPKYELIWTWDRDVDPIELDEPDAPQGAAIEPEQPSGDLSQI
ncbi:hypothetical protein BGZ59_010131 [Podila verticillata]|nr:hypothetical protein BGZ59_010131 [Podila verticillata]